MRLNGNSLLLSALICAQSLHGENVSGHDSQIERPAPTNPFKAFTGKVTRNKVRLRLQPSLEGAILKELQKGDLVIVIGETDDFYITQAPDDLKSYVFRTFILDNVVEGKHVNVRLQPDLDAPIIAQLNSGERVEGTISSQNNKWLEIPPPASARFYVAKEYIDSIGDPTLMATIKRRRDEVNKLIGTAYRISQEQLKKPYEEIQLNRALDLYENVILNYTDFPEQVSHAREILADIQDKYLQKKIAYLEAKAQAAEELSRLNTQVNSEKVQGETAENPANTAKKVEPLDSKSSGWHARELAVFNDWVEKHPGETFETFYNDQKQHAKVLTGVIEPYIRHIRNKPGDYILKTKNHSLPTAFLYSTKVDLKEKVGQEVTLIALPRPNNNYALPAYFVLSIDG